MDTRDVIDDMCCGVSNKKKIEIDHNDVANSSQLFFLASSLVRVVYSHL